MVLAQLKELRQTESTRRCFHPTMVLAQPIRLSSPYPPRSTFPSHYGSRSTKLNSEKKISSSSFHPTMVLAQPEDQAPRRPSLQFPSHYGSRSTRGANSPAQDSALRFHPTLVLAQLERLERLGYIEFGFPSHIGSRSTKIYPNGFKPTLKFPSHIGSRSTDWIGGKSRKVEKFPSHIGSRSEEPSIVSRPRAWTRPSKGREEERKRESERKERAKMGTDRLLRSVPDFRITNNRSYHPTLVLAQPN